MRRSAALLLVFGLSIAAVSGHAQDNLSLQITVPVVNLPSDLFRPDNGAAEFLGVGLAQTADDIRKILIGQNFANEDPSDNFLLDEVYYNVEIVATGPNRHVTTINWTGPEDGTASQSVRVQFASPLTGQRSTDVRRFVSYKGGMGPLVATLHTAIVQKYGPPSTDDTTSMAWFWSSGHLVKKGPYDTKMAIGMETDSDYVKGVTYNVTDVAASNTDRDAVNRFQKSVEDAAKAVRDGHATTPKL